MGPRVLIAKVHRPYSRTRTQIKDALNLRTRLVRGRKAQFVVERKEE